MAPPGGGGTFAPAVRAASRALLDWSLAQYARPSNAFCHGALVLAQLLFAGMHITAASALDHIPPFSFCALRLALALPFLYWLARREGGRALRGWERAWPLPMGAAIGTAYALVFVCNQRSGPNYTAMVQPLIPLAAAAMSAALRIERVDAMKAGGLFVSVVGTTITLRVWTNEDEAPGVVDSIFLMTQPIAYATYVVLLALALKRVRAGDGSNSTAAVTRRSVTTSHFEDEDDDDDDDVVIEGLDRPPPGPMLFLFAATVVSEIVIASGAFYTLVSIRPRWRGERRSLRTFAGVSLRPPPRFQSPPSTPFNSASDAFQLHPDVSVGVRGLVRRVEWSTLPAHAYLAVLYAGIMSSCFAHGINSWAISHVSGVLPTVYSGVQVIFTVILADIFLDEGAFYKIVSDWSPYDRVGEVDAVP